MRNIIRRPKYKDGCLEYSSYDGTIKLHLPVAVYKYLRRHGLEYIEHRDQWGVSCLDILFQDGDNTWPSLKDIKSMLEPLIWDTAPEDIPRLKLTIPASSRVQHLVMDWRLSI
jgi:hypothetical protein